MGILLAVGLLPLLAALMIAGIKVHAPNGLWSNGYENNLTLIAAAVGQRLVDLVNSLSMLFYSNLSWNQDFE